MKIKSLITACALALSASTADAASNAPAQSRLSFKYTHELPFIYRHAHRTKINPALLMGIRYAEGNASYGIKPHGKNKREYLADKSYTFNGTNYLFASKLEKDISWAAITVSNSLARATTASPLRELSRKYAPIGAKNDPRGLNANWYRNVTNNYAIFDRELNPQAPLPKAASLQSKPGPLVKR